MAKKIIDTDTLTDIADAIRTKKGTSGTIQVSDFADEIENIQTTKYGVSLDNCIGNVNSSGVLQVPSATTFNVTGIQQIGQFALSYKSYFNTSLTSFSISATAIDRRGCYYTFYGCSALASADLSTLTTISGNEGCTGMFSGCTALSSVDLSALATVNCSSACTYMFHRCTSLTSLSFPALTSTSFGSYTNQFSNMLSGVTGCTVHFPSNLQSVIGSWSDVTAGFGGTNTTVSYDLTATS